MSPRHTRIWRRLYERAHALSVRKIFTHRKWLSAFLRVSAHTRMSLRGEGGRESCNENASGWESPRWTGKCLAVVFPLKSLWVLFYCRLWPSIYLLLLFIITIYSKLDWVRFRDTCFRTSCCVPKTHREEKHLLLLKRPVIGSEFVWRRIIFQRVFTADKITAEILNSNPRGRWIGSLYNYRLYTICSSWFVCVPLQWRDCEIILQENIWAIFNAIWMDDICAFIYLILHYINVSRQAREPDVFFHWWQLVFGSIIRLRLTTLACEKKD